MEIFDAVKFKKLFAEVKEQKEVEGAKKLGLEMATTGKVSDLLKHSYKELREGLKYLTDKMDEVGLISEPLKRIRDGLPQVEKIAGPRRMW